MNKKLRALCKSLNKTKPDPQPQIDPSEPPETSENPVSALLPSVPGSNILQNGSLDPTQSHPEYKISETERRRRLITSYRSESGPSDNLTPYELAIKEAKREAEKAKEQEKLKNRKTDLETENSQRLEKNIFNVLAIFRAPNGAMSNQNVLKSLSESFKFDVDKVIMAKNEDLDKVKNEDRVNNKDFKKCRKEFRKWVDEANLWVKKRHQKYTGKLIGKESVLLTSLDGEIDPNEDYSKNLLFVDYEYP